MPHDRDPSRLWEMLSAAREVEAFARSRTWNDYQQDVMLRRAIERSVEIIGEAARRVSDEFKTTHQAIPRTKIIIQRHRLAHEYDTIDDSLIWAVATRHVPAPIAEIEQLGLTPPSC